MTDAELAHQLAQEAGERLVHLATSGRFTDLGREGDRLSNIFLLNALRQARPEDALLSEEEKDDAARLAAKRVWIIDPVDGTREFSEQRTDWAVHVALAVDGKPEVGAVALPALKQVFRSDKPVSVPPAPDRLRMVVSRTRPAPQAAAIARKLDAALVPMGSAGAKAMSILRGEADIYLHTGGQYEWDNCAPVAVALAHGLHCSHLDGRPLVYNQQNLFKPDLLICRKEHADMMLTYLASLT